jgi:glycosyltransferase involved in cell wall biosynthesis
MKLSVIICTYNRKKYIYDVLKSIAENSFPSENYELIVIDNNSSDGTASEYQRFHADFPAVACRYFVETQQGLSHARNRGIAEAIGDIIIFIDDDAIAEPDYLKEMYDFFERTTGAVACGGRIYPHFESRRPRWMSHFLLSLTSSIDLGKDVKVFRRRQFPVGANMAVRKAAFGKYGMFNSGLGRKGNSLDGAEEKDFFYRLMAAGESVYYVPGAIVHHYVPDCRLTFDFFKRQATGIGKSECIRAKNISVVEYLKSIIREGLKWGVSFVLFLFYFFTLRPAKAVRLLMFRWFVSRGLLF